MSPQASGHVVIGILITPESTNTWMSCLRIKSPGIAQGEACRSLGWLFKSIKTKSNKNLFLKFFTAVIIPAILLRYFLIS